MLTRLRGCTWPLGVASSLAPTWPAPSSTIARAVIRALAMATLWVLDGSARARRFYEAAGWAPDGEERIEQLPGFAVREVRYGRALG